MKICYCESMKNLTVSTDDDLYRAARIKAAEQSTSISGLFKAFLVRLTSKESSESTFDRLAREELEVRAELLKQGRGLNPAHNLSRDKIHDCALH